MCACSVGAPPAGSGVNEKTTFSPFCATGSGVNGFAGGLLQNRPPHALASPWLATSIRLASPNRIAIVASVDLPESCIVFMALSISRAAASAVDDANPLVVSVCDVDLALASDLDAERAIQQRRGGGSAVPGEARLAALAGERRDDPVGRHHAHAVVVAVRDVDLSVRADRDVGQPAEL